MPNFWRFNQTLFNWWRRWAWSWWMTDKVIFNWFWLLNQNFITTKLNVRNMPQINLIETSNPKSDWATLLDRFYKQRTITVEWHILWESYEDEQEKIDSLKKALSVKQWYFEFLFWDTYRRILCTLTNQDIISRESYDIEHAQFRLTFKAEMPFRSERSIASVLFEDVQSNINEDVFNPWSMYSEPTINILVWSATNTYKMNFWVWNNVMYLERPSEITSITLWDVFIWWEQVAMTSSWTNTWTWTRTSTWMTVNITLTNWVPTMTYWTETVVLTEQNESLYLWTLQQWASVSVWVVITRTWWISATDIIEVDCANKKVLYNNTPIDFTWKFPKLEAGVNVFSLQSNWTFNFDVSILFPKNYL